MLGIVIGGYLFSDTQPRSFLTLHKCENTCLAPSELLGLLASIGIQKFPAGQMPLVVSETDKTIVIKHPFPLAFWDIHYVVIPKKDIRDIADISNEDREYLFDAHVVMRDIVQREKLSKYKIITNGPGFQVVNYLHFHLVADLDKD